MSKGMTVLRARRSVGALVVVLTAAAALGVTAAPAGAWPYPFTPDQVAYLNTVRGNFPGDDDQLVTAGLQACRLLYTGQSAQQAVDATAAQYGATPDQARVVVQAARGTMCTQAPG
ncbi:DUF732 domain-containing protein [Mycolicibacterium sp.]|uniref:DUF732 domain-containing protein n=1 Tax=Mycolicibacterium sp. TaxID=2320850 RepID=UPI000A4A9D74